MKPTEILARERTPDGEELMLSRRDGIELDLSVTVDTVRRLHAAGPWSDPEEAG